METEQDRDTVLLTLTREEYRLVRLAVIETSDIHDREARASWAAAEPYRARLSEQNRDKFRALWQRLWEAANL